MRTSRSAGTFLITAALALLAGCGTSEIASRWRSPDAVLTGPGARWPAPAYTDRRMSLSVFNDSEYAYIGLRTNDRGMQELILGQGITWWFDSGGGTKRSFGVRYPPSALPRGTEAGPEERDELSPPGGRRGNRAAPTELELYSGETLHERMSILATGGIEAGFHRQLDTLVYVLRVPLAPGAIHPFGIGAKRGSLIGLGVVTSTGTASPDIPSAGRASEGEPEGGSEGFGARRTRPGGMGEGRSDERFRGDQINLWFKVRLQDRE
jgi:hypothetical protein